MVKLFSQRVYSCLGCPNMRVLTGQNVAVDWCYARDRQCPPFINRTISIPDWCPLPDYNEEEEAK